MIRIGFSSGISQIMPPESRKLAPNSDEDSYNWESKLGFSLIWEKIEDLGHSRCPLMSENATPENGAFLEAEAGMRYNPSKETP
jgi:hypothetical protein